MSYSDGCPGQNKNNAIIGFYADLTKSGMYERIDHKFLERGHTYLENDRDFAQIEKRKKTAEVFVPDDWVHIIKETNLRKPFVATKMRQEDFHDWKSYTEERYKPVLRDNDGEKVLLRDIHWMNFGWGEEKGENEAMAMKHHPGEVWVRFGFRKDEPWKKIKITRPRAPQTAAPPRLYTEPIPLKSGKVKDLEKLAKFIPEPQRQFYVNIISNPTIEDSIDNEDND